MTVETIADTRGFVFMLPRGCRVVLYGVITFSNHSTIDTMSIQSLIIIYGKLKRSS